MSQNTKIPSEQSENYEHLTDETRKALNLSDAERIKYIREPLWIGYAAAQKALKKLDILINHPKKDRMPNLLLVADTNNGKTSIINRFHQKHPSLTDEETGRVIMPFFIVQSPPVPDEVRLYNIMLNKLFAPYKERERPEKKLFQVATILERLQTRIIVLDEIHNIIAGNLKKQRQFLNSLKYLANELKIPLSELERMMPLMRLQPICSLPIVLSRVLTRWKNDVEYLQLLASFERLIPLRKASWLEEDVQTAQKILSLSEGIIGEISTVLIEAAVFAVEEKEERITLEILNKDLFNNLSPA